MADQTSSPSCLAIHQSNTPGGDYTNRTRTFVHSLFSNRDDWDYVFPEALAEDLIWTVNGSSPIAGRYESKKDYVDRVLEPMHQVIDNLPPPIVEQIMADGLWATVHWRCEGVKAKNQAVYDQHYCWLMRVDYRPEPKIAEIVSWFDPARLDAAFKGSGINLNGTKFDSVERLPERHGG